MGLFDDIRCDAPLPPHKGKSGGKERWFQTKSFDEPYLDKYAITEDRRLIELQFAPEDKRYVEKRFVEYHGYIDFYDYADKTGDWWSFRAKFTDGKLADIKLTEYRPGEAEGLDEVAEQVRSEA